MSLHSVSLVPITYLCLRSRAPKWGLLVSLYSLMRPRGTVWLEQYLEDFLEILLPLLPPIQRAGNRSGAADRDIRD